MTAIGQPTPPRDHRRRPPRLQFRPRQRRLEQPHRKLHLQNRHHRPGIQIPDGGTSGKTANSPSPTPAANSSPSVEIRTRKPWKKIERGWTPHTGEFTQPSPGTASSQTGSRPNRQLQCHHPAIDNAGNRQKGLCASSSPPKRAQPRVTDPATGEGRDAVTHRQLTTRADQDDDTPGHK